MKAKIKKTGEIIDVSKIMEAQYHDNATSGIDEKIYCESDLEFVTPEAVPTDRVIRTLRDFRKITAHLDDDFNIEMRIRRKLTDEELKHMPYPYPYETEYVNLEFDDIGYSDKDLCLGVETKDFK